MWQHDSRCDRVVDAGFVQGSWHALAGGDDYGLGKTFLWPTMLGVVGERFPRGGAITMGTVGAAAALSAGFLGGPGIGYKQDVEASTHLQAEAREAYDRYSAPHENQFLFFPPVKGLDGKKLGVLLDSNDSGWAPANTLDFDYKIATNRRDVPADLKELKTWWEETGLPHKDADRAPLENARIQGGQTALRQTAAVPMVMFFGFLFLVLYFRSRGGYRIVDIDGGESNRGSQ